jgi:5-methylthioribose kinase
MQVGIAHVEDLESIADEKLRAQCEARVLRLGRELLVHATAGFSDVAAVAAAAQKERKVRL